jgi:hypothetical protein
MDIVKSFARLTIGCSKQPTFMLRARGMGTRSSAMRDRDDSTRATLAQSHRPQRLPTLDVVREGAADVRDESLLIVSISQGF